MIKFIHYLLINCAMLASPECHFHHSVMNCGRDGTNTGLGQVERCVPYIDKFQFKELRTHQLWRSWTHL